MHHRKATVGSWRWARMPVATVAVMAFLLTTTRFAFAANVLPLTEVMVSSTEGADICVLSSTALSAKPRFNGGL